MWETHAARGWAWTITNILAVKVISSIRVDPRVTVRCEHEWEGIFNVSVILRAIASVSATVKIKYRRREGCEYNWARFGTIVPKHCELGLVKGKTNRKIKLSNKLSNTGRAGPARGGSIHSAGANSFPPRGREEVIGELYRVHVRHFLFNLHTFSFSRTSTLN